MLPSMRALLRRLRGDVVYGAPRERPPDTSFIHSQGNPTNETASRAMRLLTDDAITRLCERLDEVEGAWLLLPALDRTIADLFLWSDWRDLPAEDLGRHVGYSAKSMYRARSRILEHFTRCLSPGYDSPSRWWGLYPED